MIVYNCKDIYTYYRKQGGTLAYSVFKEIIAESNKANSQLIIGGFEYVIPHRIGMLKIVRNERSVKVTENGTLKGAVDWKASNQLKQEIIDRGEIPYESTKVDGRIVSDNGGTKWLVYRTDSCYYVWNKISGVMLHNGMKYRFTPTWTNARTLIASITEDSDLLYNVNKDRKNGTSRDYLRKILASKSGEDVRATG